MGRFIKKSITVTEANIKTIKENSINLSRFVQNKLDECGREKWKKIKT